MCSFPSFLLLRLALAPCDRSHNTERACVVGFAFSGFWFGSGSQHAERGIPLVCGPHHDPHTAPNGLGVTEPFPKPIDFRGMESRRNQIFVTIALYSEDVHDTLHT